MSKKSILGILFVVAVGLLACWGASIGDATATTAQSMQDKQSTRAK